jgi:hypothetical protein
MCAREAKSLVGFLESLQLDLASLHTHEYANTPSKGQGRCWQSIPPKICLTSFAFSTLAISPGTAHEVRTRIVP